MKKILNLYVIFTNLPALVFGVPILVILVPASIAFTNLQKSLIVYIGAALGIILAIEYDLVQRWRFKKYMKKDCETKKHKEYLFMMNSPIASAFHMFLHFIAGTVFIAIILFFTKASIQNLIMGVLDGLFIAVFMGIVNFHITQLIFFKHLENYKFSHGDYEKLMKHIRHINLKWKFLFTTNFMVIFIVFINFINLNYILYIILIVVNIILSIITIISYIQPIESVRKGIEKMFSGGFDEVESLPILSKNEVGFMTFNFNILFFKFYDLLKMVLKLSKELSEITGQLSTTGEEITASSEEVSATIQNISLDMNTQNQMIKEAKNSVTKIKSLSESVTSKVNMAQTASKKANDASSQGFGKVENTMDNFDSIVTIVNSALEKIRLLQNRSEQINEILEIITKISEQTDLLALNAAIEAARVGEHGKGFAVVAEEIRELAEQSSQSTERISKLIDEIKDDIKETASLVKNQHEKVGTGKLLMNETKDEFKQISKAITLTVNMIKEISYASEEQMTSINNYIQSINEIAELSERTSSNTEEIAASIEEQSASMEEILSNVQEIDNKANTLKDIKKDFTK